MCQAVVLINVYIPARKADFDTIKVLSDYATEHTPFFTYCILTLITTLTLPFSKRWMVVHLLYLDSTSRLETPLVGPVRWTGYGLTCSSNAKHTLQRGWGWWAPWQAPGLGPQPRLYLKTHQTRVVKGRWEAYPHHPSKLFYLRKHHTCYLWNESGHVWVMAEAFTDNVESVTLFASAL